jgi:hypothetical protein
VTIEQIATDFGVHPMTLTKRMRQADIDEGTKPGKGTSEVSGVGRAATPKSPAGAGERSPTPCGRLPAAGQSAGEGYPLVKELAADGIPVVVLRG